jgi:nucleoside-diphosphate-sugar epimerase
METLGMVLVTGASGTVGSAVAQRLCAAGLAVRGTSRRAAASESRDAERRGYALVRADLGNPVGLAEVAAGADVVVHCAATLGNDLPECIATNIEGTQNLIEALLRAGTRRLVHISTISVYDARSGLLFDEDSPIWTEPGPGYGYSKAEAERRVVAARERGLASVILRPAVVLSMHENSYWGPQAVARARSSSLPVFPGHQLPYVHIDNLSDAVLLAAREPGALGRTYNVVDAIGRATEYAAAIETAIGRATTPIPSLPLADIKAERIRRELGYAPADLWGDFLGELAQLAPS